MLVRSHIRILRFMIRRQEDRASLYTKCTQSGRNSIYFLSSTVSVCFSLHLHLLPLVGSKSLLTTVKISSCELLQKYSTSHRVARIKQQKPTSTGVFLTCLAARAGSQLAEWSFRRLYEINLLRCVRDNDVIAHGYHRSPVLYGGHTESTPPRHFSDSI